MNLLNEKRVCFMKRRLVSIVTAICAAAPIAAVADTLTWNGGASGNFSTGPWTSDGSHTAPENGDTLVFGTVGDFNNDLSELSLAGLSMTAAGPVRLGGNQIALMSGATISKSGSGTYTNNVPLVLGTASGQTVYVEVASGCTIEMLAAISGDANLVYGNTSTSKGRVNLRNNGSDYTGTTTIKRGTVCVYANSAFGTSAAGTTIQNATKNDAKTGLFFYGVTMNENFTTKLNYDSNANSNHKPVQFNGACEFNGTWTISASAGGGRIWVLGGSAVHFRGTFSSGQWNTCALFQGTVHYDGEGSSLGEDDYYGGTIYYNAHCKCPYTMSLGQSASSGWLNMTQTRYFNCENAMVYNNSTPPILKFICGGCAADMCGYDQTFRAITCDSGNNSSSIVRSTDPSTIHLTLPGSSAATCYAKFIGKVSLSFEGPRPMSLGNTANTSTGSLSLTNAAAVTLLDGFKWCGSSVTVADGSTLTVGNATFPKTLAVAINDRVASGGNGAVFSKIALNADAVAETLTINGKTRSGGRTYGATGSGADIVDDDHFSGTGKLRVRKPCGTFIIVM